MHWWIQRTHWSRLTLGAWTVPQVLAEVVEVVDQAVREKGEVVAGRLGSLSLEQRGATIAAVHHEYPRT